ncbi:MAG: TIR domain-containing protein [Cyanobacteria bacterium P01_C01_bin.118]
MTDVFISYSRKDKAFVQVLNQALVNSKYDAWVDWENIPLTADWWEEIKAGIEGADTFIFVISPDSIASKVCGQEIDHAVENNKRLLPIVYREGFEMSLVRPALGKHNWLFFKDDNDFDQAFHSLVEALNTDLPHVKEHTRLLVKALEWEKKKQRTDLLLRGQELEEVIQWLTQNAEKEPRSTQLQRDYINASRQQATVEQQAKLDHEAIVRKRITRALIAAVGGLVVAVGLGAVTFQQFRRAEAQRQDAVKAEVEALISSANALLDSEQPLDALIESLKAAHQLDKLDTQESALTYKVAGTLHQAISNTQEQNRLSDHAHWVEAVAFSPNGDLFATAGWDGAVRLWQDQGQLIMTIEGKQGERVVDLTFSPDGQTLAVSVENTIKLFNLQGQELQHFPGHTDTVTALSFSPDGQTIASSAWDGTVALWNRDGTIQSLLGTHDSFASDVKFNPDGTLLASSGADGMIKLWDRTGNLLNTWRGDVGLVHRVAFSPDGQMLASAGSDGKVKLWNMAGELLKTLAVETDNILLGVEFSPDGKRLAVATGERNTVITAVKVWSIEGNELERLEGHSSRITDASFSTDGQRIVSTSFDGTIRLWQPQQNSLYQIIDGHDDIVSSLRFAADGQTLASSSYDGTISLWQADGTLLKALDNHDAQVNALEFDSHHEQLLSVSDDKTLKVWTAQGKLQSTLKEHSSEVKSLSVSSDGEFWASVSQDGTLQLWSKNGEVLKTFSLETGFADIVRFHPHEPVLAIATGEDTKRTVLLWHWQQDILTPLNTSGSFQVRDFQFSPDGEVLATASWHGTLAFWDLVGNQRSSFFAGIDGPLNTMQFSPNGQLMALTSGLSTLLFDRQGQVVQSFSIPGRNRPFSLQFSPNGKTLATGYSDGKILLWNLDLETLVQAGCQKSEDFLQSHPEILSELPLCQTPERLRQSATVLVNQAIVQARQGNTDEAFETFQQALAWNPDLDLNPQDEVNRFIEQGEAHHLLEEGDRLASEGDIEAATEKYQAAKVLDQYLIFEPKELAQQQALEAEVNRLIAEGKMLAKQGDIEAAIAQFQAAKIQSPHLAIVPKSLAPRLAAEAQIAQANNALDQKQFLEILTAFNQAKKLYPNVFGDSALLNKLCWQGSLKGAAKTVITICNQAVVAAPQNHRIRDSRGLARALIGDVSGAIADFQFFVENTSNDADKRQRQQWIQQLKTGENPFTPKVLESL